MPKAIQFCCARTALLSWSLIWHSMASSISRLLKFDASHHAVIVLRVVEAAYLSKSHRCDCWSCKSCVPLLFFQAVLVILPFAVQISTPKLATLLQMYFKQPHEPLPGKKIAFCRCSLIYAWNSSFAPFTVKFPERYRCSLLKSFADWTNGTRLPRVHSLTNSVRQGPMCSSSMMFSMFSSAHAHAIPSMCCQSCNRMESTWDLCPMIWRIQKRRQRCRRRLLKSAPSQSWACAFPRVPLRSDLLAPVSANSVVIVAQTVDHVSMRTPKFCSNKTRLSLSAFLWFGLVWPGLSI